VVTIKEQFAQIGADPRLAALADIITLAALKMKMTLPSSLGW
jgi:hypothetical protein